MIDWKAKLQAAHEMVDALCKGKREWALSIPVRYDHDPDVIISNGLMAAEAEIEALEATLANLREIVPEDGCDDEWCGEIQEYITLIDPIRAILYAKEKHNG